MGSPDRKAGSIGASTPHPTLGSIVVAADKEQDYLENRLSWVSTVHGAPRHCAIGTRYAIWCMVQKQVPISTVLRVQSIGFLAIIGISWLNEFIDLRSLIFGNHPYISDYRESALEMLCVLAVWFLVVGATRRVIQRVHYLEGFPRVCAWCHHISFKSRWVRMEEFLEREFDTPTTHGICPTCVQKQKTAILEARKAANEQRTQGDQAAPGETAAQS